LVGRLAVVLAFDWSAELSRPVNQIAQMEVRLKIKGLTEFPSKLKSTVIPKILKQWTFLYLSFAQKHFVEASQGSGDWPPLKPSTIAGRRGKGKDVRILRDTGTLFRALDPVAKAPGSLQKMDAENFTVEVGYGGSAGHPKGRATISDIAEFHNFGMGHNPIRRIIISPTDIERERMRKVANETIQKELNKSVN